MSELSNLLKNTDFEHISLEDLVALEDSLQRFEHTSEKGVLENLKKKIADKYASFNNRFRVHKIRTGYNIENWGNGRGNISREDLRKLCKRSENGWDPNNGWKFHLDVVPNRNHPVTKSVSDFLLDLNVNHKIASGGENGKGMTVYVGSYEDVNKLAEVIQERFGKDIYEPPAYTDQAGQEYAFQPTVYGRFVPGREGDYPWGVKGIGLVYAKYRFRFSKSLEKAIELGGVKNKDSLFDPKNIFNFLLGEVDAKDMEDLYLRNYCCHKLYAEALGDYYCGSDIEAFEKNFFGDKLPAKGTEKRSKWDEVAKTFVEEAKTIEFGKDKKFFDFIKSFTDGYEPLDLSRVKMEKTSTKSNSVDEANTSKQKTTSKPVSNISVVDNPAKLPTNTTDNNHDKDFVTSYRKFYQGVAKLEKAEYVEDENSQNYNATLIRQNGEEVNIVVTPNNQVSLTGKDKDKNYKVPDYKDFNYLSLLAKKTGKVISFGNIKSPEFKARLLLACLENNVSMINVPKFSEMKDVDPDIIQRIKNKMKELSNSKTSKEDVNKVNTQGSQQTSSANSNISPILNKKDFSR